MFNVGGGELLVIFLVALIVLGPAKLPEVARQICGVMREVRRISSGFQDEMRAAMEDPVEAAARERGNRVVATSEAPAPAEELADEAGEEGDADQLDVDDPADVDEDDVGEADADESLPEAGAAEAPMSTAAAAGMYDVAPQPHPTPDPDLAPEGDGTPSVRTEDDALDDTGVPDIVESDQPTESDDEASKQAAGER
jgi:sec-independent protein translocase protein TatB